ncbi:MAG: CHRD domain-containing protein [Hyphomicrobiales bacterium]|nr:CHRD domain-containing protein [Hyphomicrobiales bacterium]
MKKSYLVLVLAATIAVGALTGMSAAEAKVLHYTAMLSGKNAVPPNDSKGSGEIKVRVNTKTMMLHWHGTYKGLTGPQTMAHFHGPAKAGTAAGVLVPAMAPSSPFKGKAKITAAVAKDIADGMVYYNVHTAAHPGGEISGWLKPAM